MVDLCQKCEVSQATDVIEVFKVDTWYVCKACETSFYNMINHYFQPERSKREDLDCCKKVKDLYDVLYNVHWEWCAFVPEDMMQPCNNNDCGTLRSLITEYKMRCSELHGNMERDK